MHLQIKAIKLSELWGAVFQLWKQKGTFNPLRLYYELGLKILTVTCESKQTPFKQCKDNEAAGVCVCYLCVCKSSFDIYVCLAEEIQLLRRQSINNGESQGWPGVLKVCRLTTRKQDRYQDKVSLLLNLLK